MTDELKNKNNQSRIRNLGHWIILPTKNYHLPSASTRFKSLSTASADLQTHAEVSSGWRSGMRHSVSWEKLADQAFR